MGGRRRGEGRRAEEPQPNTDGQIEPQRRDGTQRKGIKNFVAVCEQLEILQCRAENRSQKTDLTTDGHSAAGPQPKLNGQNLAQSCRGRGRERARGRKNLRKVRTL